MSIHCELKSKFPFVDIIIKDLNKCYEKSGCAKITVDSTSLALNCDDQHKNNNSDNGPIVGGRLLLKGVKFVPQSCHRLACLGNNDLHFRLQVERNTGLDENRPTVVSHLTDYFKDPNLTLICARCKTVLLKDTRFQRVLPLPLGDWSEMVDTWFCHNDKPSNSSSVSVRPGDCLVGDVNFLVQLKTLNSGGVVFERRGQPRCHRCLQNLGSSGKAQNKDTDVRQFSHLQLIPSSLRLSRESYLGKLLLYHKSHHNSFQFILESSGSAAASVPIIMIWLLESEVSLYKTDVTQDDQNLQPMKILKILYQDCIRESVDREALDTWQKDVRVTNISLPEYDCLHILDILIDSTLQLPRALARSHSFYVGFLRLDGSSLAV